MADQMTTGQAEAFAWFMRVYHGATPADVEPTPRPGYWRYLHPCRGCVHPVDGPFPARYPGRCSGCGNPIHDGDMIRHAGTPGAYTHEECTP